MGKKELYSDSLWRRVSKATDNFRNSSRWWFWGVDVIGSAALAALTAALTINTLPNWLVGVLTFCVFVLGMAIIYGIIYLVHLIILLKMPICEKIREYLLLLRIFLTSGKLVHHTRKSVNIRFNVKALTLADLNAKIANQDAKIENLRKLVGKNKLNGDENKTTRT